MKKIKPKERGRLRLDLSQRSRSPLIHIVTILVVSLATPWLAMAQAEPKVSPLADMLAGWLWAAWLAILLLILINSIYMAAETALELLRPGHVKLVEKEDQRSQLRWLLAHRRDLIAGCTLVRQSAFWWIVMLSAIPTTVFVKSMILRGSWNDGVLSYLLGWMVIGIPLAALNMIIGELGPKSIAIARPVTTALRTSRAVAWGSRLFSIPAKLLASVTNLITRRFGAEASFVLSSQTEEEIKTLADTASASGEMGDKERELLHSVFEFTDTIAREIMTPRVDMDALPIQTTAAEMVKTIKESGHSRIPIYEDTDDQIIGFIHGKDMLGHDPDKVINLRTLLRPVVFVPENKGIRDLLEELRRSRCPLAIVQDEYGGTAGLVTIEDIVEELVGEIVDEYDDETPDIVASGSEWIVTGKANLYDLGEAANGEFESEEFDTVGGYVFGLFGRQPKEGETIEGNGFLFQVVKTDGRRILEMRVKAMEKAETPLD